MLPTAKLILIEFGTFYNFQVKSSSDPVSVLFEDTVSVASSALKYAFRKR